MLKGSYQTQFGTDYIQPKKPTDSISSCVSRKLFFLLFAWTKTIALEQYTCITVISQKQPVLSFLNYSLGNNLVWFCRILVLSHISTCHMQNHYIILNLENTHSFGVLGDLNAVLVVNDCWWLCKMHLYCTWNVIISVYHTKKPKLLFLTILFDSHISYFGRQHNTCVMLNK